MKKKISILMIVCLATVLFGSLANAAPATGGAHLYSPGICLELSKAIQQDKRQLRSIMGYLHSYGCSREPARSSHRCVALYKKRAALEARIAANVAKARRFGCR